MAADLVALRACTTAFLAAVALSFVCFEDIFSLASLASGVALLDVILHALPNKQLFLWTHLPALFLGTVFGQAIRQLFDGENEHYTWWGYVAALSFFHFSEYFTTAMFKKSTLSFDSYLLNHSKEYGVAAVVSWIEYWIEWYFVGAWKNNSVFFVIGVILVVGGELTRKWAMFTARESFSHIVQHKKQDDHTLVTSGIYALVRHPSYVGWFFWSVGTQIILFNPICIIAYAYASFNFFTDRIEYEEEALIKMFGRAYIDYQKRVPIGIPFIQGFKADAANCDECGREFYFAQGFKDTLCSLQCRRDNVLKHFPNAK